MDSRTRVVAEAMRLFGEQGYTKTTIAEIERAAGLSPGSGALYRHFRSKEDLLAEGVRSKIAENAGLLDLLSDGNAMSGLQRRDQLAAIARAGLRRLDAERDLNRMVVRDLALFPGLLAEVRDAEMREVHGAVAAWLRSQSTANRDWEALAVVLVGGVSHFWLLTDVFGGHPSGLSEDRCVEAIVVLGEGLLAEE